MPVDESPLVTTLIGDKAVNVTSPPSPPAPPLPPRATESDPENLLPPDADALLTVDPPMPPPPPTD